MRIEREQRMLYHRDEAALDRAWQERKLTCDIQKKTFDVLVNDTEPIWLYCTFGHHCQDGQVLVVNPPKE